MMWTILVIFLYVFFNFPWWAVILIMFLEYMGDTPIFQNRRNKDD